MGSALAPSTVPSALTRARAMPDAVPMQPTKVGSVPPKPPSAKNTSGTAWPPFGPCTTRSTGKKRMLTGCEVLVRPSSQVDAGGEREVDRYAGGATYCEPSSLA